MHSILQQPLFVLLPKKECKNEILHKLLAKNPWKW